jgi:DNA-binding transcriptional MerR regulator
MLRISEFARAGNVTVRTVRFYDEVGLLRPAHVSYESGYRSYSSAQIAQLNQIQAFKDMGFALGEILDLLRRPLNARELRGVLRERREALRGRVREDVGRLARIEARLSSLEGGGTSDSQVLFGETREQWVVSVREKLGSYDETEQLFGEIARRVDTKLLAEGRATIWHSCMEGEGRIDCEAVRFLKRPMTGLRGLKSYALPPAKIAFAYHYGSEESIGRTYQAISNCLAKRGYRVAGAKREVYWAAGRSGGEAGSLTEVQFPVSEARAAPRAGRTSSAQLDRANP